MTASYPSRNTPAEILPPNKTPFLHSILSLPLGAGTRHQSPQGLSAKHKNSFFESLLLQIGSMQGVHFHALCLLQLFKSCSYARKHRLIHKPTGHFMTKEMEMYPFRGNVWVLRHVKARLTQLEAIYQRNGTVDQATSNKWLLGPSQQTAWCENRDVKLRWCLQRVRRRLPGSNSGHSCNKGLRQFKRLHCFPVAC